jgi:uncharacterized membrane protein YukC
MSLKKTFFIVGCILLALIIGGISYTNFQEQKIKQATEQIDKSIKKDDYKTVLKILENTDRQKLQQYSDYDLQYIQSELN